MSVCQLCKTGVDVLPIGEGSSKARGHLLNWGVGFYKSAWVPCSEEDRKKAEEYQAHLTAQRVGGGNKTDAC